MTNQKSKRTPCIYRDIAANADNEIISIESHGILTGEKCYGHPELVVVEKRSGLSVYVHVNHIISILSNQKQ